MTEEKWILFVCNQETGDERVVDSGSKKDMLKLMDGMARRGGDVWLVGPSGDKIVPVVVTKEPVAGHG